MNPNSSSPNLYCGNQNQSIASILRNQPEVIKVRSHRILPASLPDKQNSILGTGQSRNPNKNANPYPRPHQTSTFSQVTRYEAYRRCKFGTRHVCVLVIGPARSEISFPSHIVLSKNSMRHPSATVFKVYAEATPFKSARQPVLPLPAWSSLVPLQVFVGYRSNDHWISRGKRGKAVVVVVKRSAAVPKARRVKEGISKYLSDCGGGCGVEQ